MSEIPHATLSDELQERMAKRRLRSAVFVTYRFEPGFFEQEVLPVFLDLPASHATVVRLLQLEDALRDLPGQIAVYYDAGGLAAGDAISAKLDVRRIPIRHRTGVFHPKLVLALVEAETPDEEGEREQALIVGVMSANLTRAGWWENVEACHIEEIGEGARTRIKDDLVSFLEALRRRAGAEGGTEALSDVLTFLRRTEQIAVRSTGGQIHTHFYGGRQSVPDFLDEVAGSALRGSYLEVISPYFDNAKECGPLLELIDRFTPREVRVFLPRSDAGEALCRRELYESVRSLDGVSWGSLPKSFLKMGKSEDAAERRVHAKVYRFFTQNPKREIYFVGSPNLTTAGHSRGGNMESGVLVDVVPARRPDFWLTLDDKRPTAHVIQTEDEGATTTQGARLSIRYWWDKSLAEAFWDAESEPPALRLEARGRTLGTIARLAPRTWTALSSDIAASLRGILDETSVVQVHGDRDEPAWLLVQEEGMSHKPSLLFKLSAADILRYWSLLTQAQRAAFLETRASEIAALGPGADLITKVRPIVDNESLFQRFAGVFHAFACLDRSVRASLDEKREKEATYRIFGQKYDSLGHLLDRVLAGEGMRDDVDQYVTVLCARQLCDQLARDYPDYWREHREDAKALHARFDAAASIRGRIAGVGIEEADAFLEWFEHWFLRRAEPVEAEA